jgi:hypothetical protein
MTHSVTTRGLQELGQFRARLARDYGVGRVGWVDFEYLNIRLNEVEERLVEMASSDPQRLQAEEQHDDAQPQAQTERPKVQIPQQRNEGVA